jgi:hypothetical protein
VRLYPSGVKSWVVTYPPKDGREVPYRGSWAGGAAHAQSGPGPGARAVLCRGSGRDPAEELRRVRRRLRAAPLVENLHRRYMTDYAIPHKRKVSSTEDERLFRTVILPALGSLRVEEVDRDEITRLPAYRLAPSFGRARPAVDGPRAG